MDPAALLNATLARAHPAAAQSLSDLGARLYYPKGIPSQSAEARGCEINATIGQITDGHGQPLTLSSMADHLLGLDPREVFLYSAQGGAAGLREAWRARTLARGVVPTSSPLVACGLSHGVALVADLFTDPDTDVLIPNPCWGNYRLIFGTRRGARLVEYPAMTDHGLDLDGLAAALGRTRGKKTVVVLNYPGNPTGYMPSVAEGQALVELLRGAPGPLVVLCDDAYQDMVWEPGCMARSPFYDLAGADPERMLVIKVDGATKELLFFGGRVGFVTFGVEGEAAAVLEEKGTGALRSSVSSLPGPSQALVAAALRDPATEAQRAVIMGEMAARYRVLKGALDDNGLSYLPFNGGVFALVRVSGDPEAIRKRLITEAGVGVVSSPDAGALRVAYCSVSEDGLVELARRLRQHLG